MDAEAEHADWGPFGRPLFADQDARALSRVGVVDIGSNSVRLVVFDGAARSPAYFYNEKIMCGLGAGMSETGRLNPEGRARALAALRRFALLSEGMNAPLTLVATAAVRDAEDGPDFRAEVNEETGLTIWVIDGEEEARLSAQGVLLGWPGSYGLVCDIGGSSMELAEISGGSVGRRVSSPLGPLKLRDMDGGKKAREKHIKEVMSELANTMGTQRDRLFLVGGSWRAIARIDMERRGYPLHVLHEYRMDADAVADTAKYIEKADMEELRGRCGLSSSRAALVPYASEVLRRLVSQFTPADIAISSYGIREGLLYEQMPQRLRDRDPLIESCYFAEAKDARLPGFGRRLFDFVRPLFPDAGPARMRLVKAACLLHDVSWRAHPDYRAETCFDNATRANLGGLKHSERVFLGLALLHRYRNKREGSRFEHLGTLLDADETRGAEILGKALRFGAMLWMSEESTSGARLKWDPLARILRLELTEGAAALFGEVAEARFKSLAGSLDAETEVRVG
ncbi:Ppx/GppA family phosphatase [Roseivivax sediminis]|uniref:Exopolyphosphatase / guanosine-5'-triphosphate,3'-diphosphate pyrophosphatase n=1 Tax=Roseivivax sediminis TaxID=936889 RepID=A0A1I1XK37_9RHOB|nr:Ppx/GppA family phosphatase [Roseivivax sediminis]SFE07727.1 exopolyphosphatase / guanosine-5'-triphosphate,3'-diphosphate pyrophosphatase [Roseivivax sediminis]